MTKVEAIIRALTEEVRARAKELEQDDSLRNVLLQVNMDLKNKSPREVIFRKESRSIRVIPITNRPYKVS